MRTIKSKIDFERVFTRGRKLSDSLLRVRIVTTQDTRPGRVAFVAAKRLGTAVFRNRCKRVLREAARISGLPRDNYDIILMSTHATHDCSPDKVARSLNKLLDRANV